MSEPGVPERIRLSRHPIRIAGSDRVPVFLREAKECLTHRVQRGHHFKRLIPEHRSLIHRVHILGGPPRVDQRDIDSGLGN